jgi:hypothetical protein
MKKLLFALCVVVMFSTSANAVVLNGNDLVKNWKEYKKLDEGRIHNVSDAGYFMGYVSGIVDAFHSEFLFNPPYGSTVGQLCSVVGKWLDNHPEEWNKPAGELVTKALQSAFLLKKK